MGNNSVIIASTAGFLVTILRALLQEENFKVYAADNEKDLYSAINMTFPRLVFIEHCFHGNNTADYIFKMMRVNQNLHIVIWAFETLNPVSAARFIHAGAESFISMRDSAENIGKALGSIAEGKRCCPADVEAALNSECAVPLFGKKFTSREIEIIDLVYLGNTNVVIAKILEISENTVRFHKKNIYRKLGGECNSDILRNGLAKKVINPNEQ